MTDTEYASKYSTLVNFIKVRANAKMPTYGTEMAAGADLYSADEYTLFPHHRVLVKTGIAIALPRGYEAQVRGRSGLAYKNGVCVLNSPGTIDADYRGEVCVLLYNSDLNEPFHIAVGDRIGQLVIAKHETALFYEQRALSETIRGAGGYGSTGK